MNASSFFSKLLYVALLSSGSSSLRAQPEAVIPVPSVRPDGSADLIRGTLKGTWMLSYGDAQLGQVTGTATANADGTHVVLELVHRPTRQVRSMESTRVTWNGSKVRIELVGRSPHGPPVEAPDLSELPKVMAPEAAEELIVRVEDAEERIPLLSYGMPDADRVVLELEQQEDGSLTGTWSSQAHALTERDAYGVGRTGRFERVEDPETGELLGKHTGDEIWEFNRPSIELVVSVSDQAGQGFDRPNYAYADLEGYGNRVRAVPQSSSRTLMVFGRNLPKRRGDRQELRSVGETQLRYEILALENREGYRMHGPEFRDGWKRIREIYKASGFDDEKIERAVSNLEALDSLLLRVWVEPRARSGTKKFTLNGAKGEWPLMYGDNSAQIGFSRDTSENEQLFTDTVFPGETVRVRVVTRQDTPYEKLAVVFGKGDTVYGFDGKRTLELSRQGPQPDWRVDRTGLPKPMVYVSKPITLFSEGSEPPPAESGGYVFPVIEGNTLKATLPRHYGFLIAPETTEAFVHQNPAQLGTTWKEALVRAARCKGIAVSDFNKMTNKEAKEISNFIITEWEDRKIRVTLADHAAMLLLREEFVRMMRRQLQEYEQIQGKEMLLAFAEQVRPQVEGKRSSPISRIEITAPNGHPLFFGAVYDEEWVMKYFKLNWFQFMAWRDRALQEGMNKIRENVRNSLTKAENEPDCDVEDLLELTAYGFDHVGRRVASRLVKLEEVGTPPRLVWVQDKAARQAVMNLDELGRTVRALEDYADLDTTFVLLTATALAMPIGWVGEAGMALTRVGTGLNVAASKLTAGAYGLALAVDTADLAYSVFHELPSKVLRDMDSNYQRGAMFVTGVEGYDAAVAREKSWAGVMLAVGGSSLGVFGSKANLAHLMKQMKYSKSLNELRKGGAAATEAMRGGGIERFQTLTPEQKALFSHHVADAMETEATRGANALTQSQREALDIFNTLRNEPTLPAANSVPEAPARLAQSGELDRTIPPSQVDEKGGGITSHLDRPLMDPELPRPVAPDSPPATAKELQAEPGLQPKDPVTLPSKDPNLATLPPKSPKVTLPGKPPQVTLPPRDPTGPVSLPPRAPKAAEPTGVKPGSVTASRPALELPPRRNPFSEPPSPNPQADLLPRGSHEALSRSRLRSAHASVPRGDLPPLSPPVRKPAPLTPAPRDPNQVALPPRQPELSIPSSNPRVSLPPRTPGPEIQPIRDPGGGQPARVEAAATQAPGYFREAPTFMSRPIDFDPAATLAPGYYREAPPLISRPVDPEVPQIDPRAFESGPTRGFSAQGGGMPVAEAAVPAPRVPPPGFPRPHSSWIPRPGAEPLQLGNIIGEGRYATVYELITPAGTPRRVVKIYRQPLDSSTPAAETVRNVVKGSELIGDEIPQLKILSAHPDAPNPYMIQEALDPETMTLFSKRVTPEEFSPEFQEAVVKLYKKFAEKGLVWEDGHIENIYFFKEGAEMKAGVLDSDRIARWGEYEGIFGENLKGIMQYPEYGSEFAPHHIESLRGSNKVDEDLFPDADFFMEKMFEYGKRWMRYNGDAFEPILIDPRLVAKHFPELPEHIRYDFRAKAPSADAPEFRVENPDPRVVIDAPRSPAHNFNPAAPREMVNAEELNNLSANLKRAMDKAVSRHQALKANKGSARRTAYAKDRLDDLKQREAILKKFQAEAAEAEQPLRLSPADKNWLAGARRALSPSESRHARNLLASEYAGRWDHATDALANGSAADQLALHRLGAYRKQIVDRLLTEVMNEIQSIRGGTLEKKAFGSTNLDSDYDLSISGPGAERVVGEFNRRFRARYGREPGTFFDTNVYTDPVYSFIDPSSAVGRRITPAQRDVVRQFMYEQMANAKYKTPRQWQRHVEAMVEASPDELKETIRRLLREVEGQQAASEREFSKAYHEEVARSGEAGEDVELRVRNELYSRSLERIDQLRRLRSALQSLGAGRPVDLDVLDELSGLRRGDAMTDTPFGRDITEYTRLKLAGKHGEAAELLEDMKAVVNSHLRHNQGHALYYASEAYQTQGTIAHVVDELQAGGRAKSLTGADLLNPPPAKPGLTPAQYSNSYFENEANLYKELNSVHKKMKKLGLDPDQELAEAVRAGPEGLQADAAVKVNALTEKAAVKTSKYFVRQLDAAHRAGVHLVEALPERLTYLIDGTVDLEKVRGERVEFRDLLGVKEKSAGEFVQDSLEAADILTRKLAAQSPLKGMEQDLADYFRELDAAMADLGVENVRMPRFARRFDPDKIRSFAPPEELARPRNVRRFDPERLADLRNPASLPADPFPIPEVELPRSIEAPDVPRGSASDAVSPGTVPPPAPGPGPGTVPPPAPGPGGGTVPPLAPMPNAHPLPQPHSRFTATDGREFDLAEPLGSGKFVDAIGLGDRPGEAVKFMRRGDSTGPNNAMSALETAKVDKAISDELHKAGVRQLRVLEVGGTEHNAYLIVEKGQKGQHQILSKELTGKMSRDQMIEQGLWSVDHEKAVVELYADLARKGFIWEDGHFYNMFFERVDGKLVAGVLDHGRLAKWKEYNPVLEEWIMVIERLPLRFGIISHAGATWSDSAFKSPQEFMAKMLEHKGLIQFDESKGVFVPRRMHPDSIDRNLFPLEDYVRPRKPDTGSMIGIPQFLQRAA